MSNVVHLNRPQPDRLLSKKQLAAELGRSPRWVELRMLEGLPVQPRKSRNEHARFDLGKVRDWLEARAAAGPARSLEERVAVLERELVMLAARVDERERKAG